MVVTKPGRPPGPRGKFLAGSLIDFVTRRFDFFADVVRDYGDLASFRFGPRRIYLASHPDLIEQVLVTDAKHYIKHFGARLYKPVLGNGLVTSEGDFWLRQRRLAQPAFSKAKIHGYAGTMVQLTESAIAGWRPGQRRDVHDEFSKLTSAIALKTLFGIDEAGDRAAFTDALYEAFELMGNRILSPVLLPTWVPTPGNLRLNRARRKIFAVVDGFIRQGRARKEPGDDLLSTLIQATDEDGSRMTDRQLRDEAMTLYLAGHETTALTLSWAWYLLAQNPDAEADLVAEWSSVLGGRAPTVEDLPRLPVTEWTILEAMRVYPPVYLLGREATRPLELGGYRVPKGVTVFMAQWVVHRDPRWFEDPLAFRPRRWADGLAKRIPKYAYFPFGGGPRVCIGNTFALMEAALLLATVGQKWRFTLEAEPPVVPWPSITLVPEFGVHATLAQR
jgi:cytochrome P450